MAYVPLEEFGIMRNLRTVGIAKTRGNIMNMQGKYIYLVIYSTAIQYEKGYTFFKPHFISYSGPSANAASIGSTIVRRPTFADFAPGLEQLDLVNAGITEIDKVSNTILGTCASLHQITILFVCFVCLLIHFKFFSHIIGCIYVRAISVAYGSFQQ